MVKHIEQKAIGGVTFGNAGISRIHKAEGYICHFCTVNEEGRFVDIALRADHLEAILMCLEGDGINHLVAKEP